MIYLDIKPVYMKNLPHYYLAQLHFFDFIGSIKAGLSKNSYLKV